MKKSYKDYVCPKCFSKIDECKCQTQSYTLLMIDEPIQKAIKILNEKLYYTEACCAGHYQRSKLSSMYIYFSFFPNSMPQGWIKSGNGIYYNFKPQSKKEFVEIQTRELAKLNKWVQELKNREV